jgi:hypothetical protein
MHCAAFGIPAGVIMPQLLNPLLFALTVAVRLLLGSVVFVNLEAHAPPSFAGNSQRGDVGSACFMSKARMWLRALKISPCFCLRICLRSRFFHRCWKNQTLNTPPNPMKTR